ncbi:sulfurtransferase [Marilutibacter aestuarii]|uniref:Sulfurtransferase n=1 Tax=Marilutibacter aestuarii TaxID=1706195 RepID=A0A508ACF7_9GAMM|nr:sulfurtransferase [Lysobacter aestuarii]TQD47599.1 sulfurtransferase [Lysobacter aestuarii]
MIVNIAAYHFTPLDAPRVLADRLRERAEAGRLRGTVLVAEEGLNLFLAGKQDDIEGFLADLRRDARFADIVVKSSLSRSQPFARLKVKVKREIIAFRRGDASPLARRAPTVAPADLARWLSQGHDDTGRRLVLFDTRNREEVGYGSFTGALTLPIDNFTDLPEALSPHREALADATVVSFCTGGIRCEKAALWMQASGMDNVVQLDGGILGYFEQVGGAHYEGRCFVFDGRVALDPALQPLVDAVDPATPVAA